MTTDRGFVQSIDVGRGGLVTVRVLLGDGSVAVYVISDIDGDPERFNERLSKLALLRDAMNRAEPVEIDHDQGQAGEEIERAERITRDTLSGSSAAQTVSGLVIGVLVHTQNAAGPSAEVADFAEVALVTTTGETGVYRLSMQVPERATASAQLGVLRDAAAAGSLVRLTIGAPDQEQNTWILTVATGTGSGAGEGKEPPQMVAGFVESVSLIPLSLGSFGGPTSLATVEFTTAPEFTGPGGTVDTAPFTPATIQLLVVEGTLTYDLILSGLEDNYRMEIAAVTVGGNDNPPDNPPPNNPPDNPPPAPKATNPPPSTGILLVTGAELLAPLASASRPVWIQIDRDMLDRGPDGDCVPGVPSSDLTPQSLRDLGLPYTAVWRGLGCFNRGVYRFQIGVTTRVCIQVDERTLCLYASDEQGIQFAYACVEGDHEVRVEIEGWTCGSTFDLDVYRVR